MPKKQAIITLTDVSVHTKQGLTLVEPISLTLHQGENLTILGETGSGKSLLAQAIMHALPKELIHQGQIIINGNPQTVKSAQTLWGKTLAMLPQEPSRSLDPTMTAINQIYETARFVAKSQNAFDTALKSLDRLRLSSFANFYPHQLSGGMAQRVAFLSATLGGATIIIADEPTKGLDQTNRQAIIELLKSVSTKGGTVLTITHDIEVARQLSHTIMVMKKGQLLEQGSAYEVLNHPKSDYARKLINAEPKMWQPLPKTKHENPLVTLNNITLMRGQKKARMLFSNVNLTLMQGQTFGLIGDSGLGKSSFGDMLCGIISPSKGTLTWHIPKTHSNKPSILKLYQDPPTAFANHIPLQTLINDILKKHRIDSARVPPLLERLHLSHDILKRSAQNVSGGELQRIAILRALLLDPVLLFADEVTSRLDPITQKLTLDLLTNECQKINCTLIMVSHDHHLTQYYCDEVMDLSHFVPRSQLNNTKTI